MSMLRKTQQVQYIYPNSNHISYQYLYICIYMYSVYMMYMYVYMCMYILCVQYQYSIYVIQVYNIYTHCVMCVQCMVQCILIYIYSIIYTIHNNTTPNTQYQHTLPIKYQVMKILDNAMSANNEKVVHMNKHITNNLALCFHRINCSGVDLLNKK